MTAKSTDEAQAPRDFNVLYVVGIIVSTTFGTMSYGFLTPLIVVNLSNHGFANLPIGAVLGAWYAPIFVLSRSYASILGSVGGRAGSIWGLLFASLSISLFGIAVNPYYWIVLELTGGAAFGAAWVFTESLINYLTPADRKGLVLTIYGISPPLGAMLGSLLPRVFGIAGQLPFLIAAALMALGLLTLVACYLKNPPRPIEGRVESPAGAGRGGFFNLAAGSPYLLILAFLSGVFEEAPWGMLSAYALQQGVAAQSAILFTSVFLAGQVALTIPIGMLADRFSHSNVLKYVAICIFALTLLVHFCIAGPFRWPLIFIWAPFVSVVYPLSLALMGDRYSAEQLISINALFVMFYSLGSLIGPVIIGLAMDLVGAFGFPLVIAGLALVALVSIRVSARNSD
jgi:MFS family permease